MTIKKSPRQSSSRWHNWHQNASCAPTTVHCELTFQKTFSFTQLLFNRRESSFQRHFKGPSLVEENCWNMIYHHALCLSQDCYFSHFRLSFSYQKHQITFCIHSSKPGCEIYCCFLWFFQQRMEKPTEVWKKQGIAEGTWGTRLPLLKRHWPRYTSQLWSENRMINSSKKGPPIVHMALACHQQQHATQS